MVAPKATKMKKGSLEGGSYKVFIRRAVDVGVNAKVGDIFFTACQGHFR